MNELTLDINLLQQQQILALRKPFETIEQTAKRLFEAALEQLPSTNCFMLKRSERRWTLLTPEQERQALIESGLIEEDDDFDCEDITPLAEYESPHDFNAEQVYRACMDTLHRFPKGKKFSFRDIVHRTCPMLGKCPHTYTTKVYELLTKSPQFMRHVQFTVNEAGALTSPLRKV